MATLLREFRYAFRQLVRAPLATSLLLVVLGLAIGLNVTLFSVLDAALFRPLSLPEADRLVNIYSTRAGRGGDAEPRAATDRRREPRRS